MSGGSWKSFTAGIPILCAAMPKGTPRVDLAALLELKRLLMCAADTTHSWGDSGILRKDHHDASQAAVDDRWVGR
jgi:hypothetical protein